ncbi:MAG: VTT domain-containing protein [Marmoricola sp.]|nr:VTT domain-containing protein [Marmoricola sp.]
MPHPGRRLAMIAVLTPLLATLGPVALALLMLVLFVETGLLVGSFLPGDSLLFAAGVLVASHALPFPIWLVVPTCAVAAIAGDQVGYLLGRRFGSRIFSGSGTGVWGRVLDRHHADRAARFFAAHGGRAIVMARFVPVVRGFTPAAAGLARMPQQRFSAYNVGGGAVWVTLMLLAGFYAGGIPLVAHHVELMALVLASAGLVPMFAARWRARAARRRQAALVPDDEAPEVRELAGV